MTYYIEKDGKIVLFDTDKQTLQETLKFMPQYAGLEIQETTRPIVRFEFADTPQYAAQQAVEQQETLRGELLAELSEIDLKTIRALRAMSAGVGSEADKNQLENLENQAAQVRARLQELV